MLIHGINTKRTKSINVFKNHPSNKIKNSNGGVPCGEFELCGLGLRLYFLLMVLGSEFEKS